MATKKRVKAIIQLRRATEAEWVRVDPVLRKGEPALSTDVYKLKIGDGVKKWSEIGYLKTRYIAGDGIDIQDDVISVNDLILDCGTSTTNI